MTAMVVPYVGIPEGQSLSAHLLLVIHPRFVTSYPVVGLYDASRGVNIHKAISYSHTVSFITLSFILR